MEELIKLYGFNKSDEKWNTIGGELLQYIGLEVIYIQYQKDPDDETKWKQLVKTVILDEMDEFNPVTVSYKIKYHFTGSNVYYIDRIIPDGYKYQEDQQEGAEPGLFRLIPISTYSKLIETESFYKKLPEIYNESKTLDVEMIKFLSKFNMQNNPELLNYSLNIAAIIKTETDEFVTFRVGELKLSKVTEEDFVLTIFDQNGKNLITSMNVNDKEYKILDNTYIKLFNLGELI